MKIRILSDLHLEFYDTLGVCGISDNVACDAVVLAGDIHNGTAGIEWAARTFETPVIYVMGNHEFYAHDAAELLPHARACADDLGVYLLERDEAWICGTRFLGCTLWTGFDAGPIDWIHATRIAHPVVADFSQIRNSGRLLSPSQMIEWYEQSLAWLKRNLDATAPTVVVTHFAPTRAVVNPRFGAGDELTPYFHNNLDDLMGSAAPLWIYGHNHFSADKFVNTETGTTRVISNQLGYPDEGVQFQVDCIANV
ncbi:MAG: metallophosphoesterase [Nitrosospira sp.]|nr:metallophosphoesterase [Nitrosospira sp.]